MKNILKPQKDFELKQKDLNPISNPNPFFNVSQLILWHHSAACIITVSVHVCVNNFSSKTTRPRDMLIVFKDTLSIEDEKLFKACRSVCLSVPQSLSSSEVPPPKV